MKNSSLLTQSPKEFIQFLKEQQIKRFYFVFDAKSGKARASHAALEEIAEFLNHDLLDFMKHEGLFFQVSEKYDTIHGAFIHKTKRGQGAGGVRYWNYNTMEAYLRDGMRLAKGMGRKNALAGLWWGGAKGVMTFDESIDKKDPVSRELLYQEYGSFITSLNGVYVTAEDVGTNEADMANIFKTTRFTTCIPSKLGGSGNPSIATARGVVSGLEAGFQFLDGSTIKGKTIAVQGLGNVGTPFIQFVLEKGAKKVISADIFEDRIELTNEQFKEYDFEAILVEGNDNSILFEECDALAPCATGGIINPETIPHIKAKIICGAANNQLADAVRDDNALKERGIMYIPDFLTNRMGIVNCANEQAGFVNKDPFIERHLSKDWEHSVYQTTLKVLKQSIMNNMAPGQVALAEADRLSEMEHPIFGHRGQQIIHSLVENKWEQA